MENIRVNGINILIEHKKIKNLHLYVKPPIGNVSISAPIAMPTDRVRLFAVSNISWIRKQIATFQNQERQTEREYVSGESIYVWGKRYNVRVIYSNKCNDIKLSGNIFMLQVRKTSTAEQRGRYVSEWYRQQLKEALPESIAKCEKLTGLRACEWKVKEMSTKWGTCNIDAKRIWINLRLVKRRPVYLEYVIIHELVHLLERRHNETFKKYMDKFCPRWRSIRRELNREILETY